MLRVGSISLFFLLSFLPPVIATAQDSDIHVFVCFDCTYQDKPADIRQRFQQGASCESDAYDNDLQSDSGCEANEFFVFNPSSEEVIAFRSSAGEHLSTAPTETTRDLIKQHYRLYTALMTIQREVAADWSADDVTAPLTDYVYPPDSVFAQGQQLTSYQQHCIAQPGHMATYMTFSDTFRHHIEKKMNEDFRSRIENSDIRPLLNQYDIEQFSFLMYVAATDDRRMHIYFESMRFPPMLRFNFGQADNLNFYELGLSSVQYGVRPRSNGLYMDLLTEFGRLTLLGGAGMLMMSPDSATAIEPKMDDACVVKALSAHFAFIEQNEDGSIRRTEGFEGLDLNADELIPRREDGTPARTSNVEGYCRMTYYRGAQRFLTMLVPCS